MKSKIKNLISTSIVNLKTWKSVKFRLIYIFYINLHHLIKLRKIKGNNFGDFALVELTYVFFNYTVTYCFQSPKRHTVFFTEKIFMEIIIYGKNTTIALKNFFQATVVLRINNLEYLLLLTMTFTYWKGSCYINTLYRLL